MTLNAGIIGPESEGFITQNDIGEWEGFHLDFLATVAEHAKNDGVTLTVNIDYDNAIPTSMDYTPTLEKLDAPCNVDNCEAPMYDMIVADYVSLKMMFTQ